MLSLFDNQQYASNNFFLLAGPCVIENESIVMETAEQLAAITRKLEIPFVFKASYRKANRTRLDSFTGIGDREGLELLKKVRDTFNIPVVTDIHDAHEAAFAAPYVDVLQIPAFLCRQTDILVAAAQTGRYVNIKKGQFLSPESMQFCVDKVVQSGNNKVMLTDRGTFFGYQDLVVDYRSIPTFRNMGVPAVMDCTHSLQQPNQAAGVTGGNPQMIATIARAAIAVGADGLFIETHPDPKNAKSDGANMLPLQQIETLLSQLTALRQTVNLIDSNNK